ncbi:MAG: xanthine dehydrogenase family protein molybdopterin-binding subunit [Proteobacteria bacterium]|nr:xanthine dehydrogenase family protein molybdopterin-binding subunit [Pseudomonadota bacterium]
MTTTELPRTVTEAPADTATHVVIGQRVAKIEGVDKVTGKALYGADTSRPGMLWGKMLPSPHAHAMITSIDVSAARALPGVFAVITGADLPTIVARISDTDAAPEEFDTPSRGKQILAWKKVVFFGQPVAAVAAVTQAIAEEALTLIKVEYSPLPVVIDPEAAMRPDAPLVQNAVYTETFSGKATTPSNIAKLTELSRGNVDEAISNSDVTVSGTFRTAMVHQGYIEPQACLAEYSADGRFTIWTSTQGQFGVRGGLSGFLKIPPRRIRVTASEIGGGFGAKGAMTLEPICTLLAYSAGRPVKMQLTRSEVLRATRPAPDAVMHVTLGARKDGTLLGARAAFIWDVGAYPGGGSVGGINCGFGPYIVPAYSYDGYDVLTNRPSTGAYRAPNGPQGAFAVESALDMLASKLGMSPVALRLKNAVREGDRNPSDVPYPRIGFRETLEAIEKHPVWASPKAASSRPGWIRGRGVACGLWGGGVGTSMAHVNIGEDGSAVIVTGAVDLAGTRTTMAQIAAEELQIPFERVNIVQPDTDTAPFNNPTGGSRITYSLGTAVYRASIDARTKLKQRASQQFRCPADEVDYRGVVQGIGWALTEGYVYDEQGRLRNPGLLDYRMPTALDAPNIECVLVEVPAIDGPYGVRGVGEVPIVPTPAAVANAVFDACAGRVTSLPLSGEPVILAINDTKSGVDRSQMVAFNLGPISTGSTGASETAVDEPKLATEVEDYCAEDDVAEPELE